MPDLGIFWGPSDDGFTEFGAAPAFCAEDVADDRFEGEVMFASGAFELAPGITVAGRGEAEVAAEIEEVVLDFDRFIVCARRREGSAEHVFIVDEEDGGTAGAEKDAMLAGGEGYFREGANQEGIVSGAAHTGFKVFVWNSEETEGRCVIGLGGSERIFWPEVRGGIPVFADFDDDAVWWRFCPIDFWCGDGVWNLGFGRFFWRIGDIVSRGLWADFGERGLRGWREGCDETGGEFGIRDEGAVEFDFVELASVAAAGVSSHG